MAEIKTVDLRKSYHTGHVDLDVLSGVDLVIETGETISIIGASGVGKSTLLNLMGGLDRPTSGRILYEDQDIFDLTER